MLVEVFDRDDSVVETLKSLESCSGRVIHMAVASQAYLQVVVFLRVWANFGVIPNGQKGKCD